MNSNRIFDVLRRKYVALTPEEGVRQHFIKWLIERKGYPQGLLVNEVELSCGTKKMRCDTVLYNRNLLPVMIIEYKAPHIELSQKVLNQLLDYNSILSVEYLVMTNGRQSVVCRRKERKLEFLNELPNYGDL